MNEKRAQIAWDLHKEIVENEKGRRLLMAKNAELLSKIYDHNYYQELLGDEQGKWSGYLGELNVFYSRSKVFNLVAIYKKFTNELNISSEEWIQIPTSRLVDILPFITKENYEDWFSKALTLTGRDWLIESRRAKGLVTEEDEHQHRFVKYDICEICGKKECTHEVVEQNPTPMFSGEARPSFFKKPKK